MKSLAWAVLFGIGVLGCSSDSDAPGPKTGSLTDPRIAPIIPEPSAECPDLTSGSQMIMGLNTRILAGPPGTTKGPLLLTWHGTGGSGDFALAQVPKSVQDDIVAKGGMIVAPSDNGQVREGQDVTFVLGVWYDTADLAFADLIVACAVKNHNIDPRQIYVTGCSAGGLMAGVMSLQRSSYVAAVAPNSGGTVAELPLQDPERVPAAMTMHGGMSDTVIVNFGDMSHNLQNILVPAGSAMVVECNHGLGHCRAPAELNEKAWAFLKAHPFGTKPSPYADGLPPDFPSYCAIVQ